MRDKEPMDTTEFDHQRDQFSDQAEGRAAAYAFIREIVALMNLMSSSLMPITFVIAAGMVKKTVTPNSMFFKGFDGSSESTPK